MELLGNIDLNSEALPTLDNLTQIFQVVGSADPKLDYNALESTIKNQLPPQCRIQTSNVTAAPVASEGNLQTIIAKTMHEILEELKPNKEVIDLALGKGFYDSLAFFFDDANPKLEGVGRNLCPSGYGTWPRYPELQFKFDVDLLLLALMIHTLRKIAEIYVLVIEP